jgi:hypothetical protein
MGAAWSLGGEIRLWVAREGKGEGGRGKMDVLVCASRVVAMGDF